MLTEERESPHSAFRIPHWRSLSKQHWKVRFLALTLMILPCFAHGADSIDWAAETLSGDWNGTRSAWSEKGINTELAFKSTLMTNPVGGVKQGSDYMQNLELKVGVDTAKLWGIPDSSAYIHMILNSGGKINAAYVGSQMGVDNIEAPDNTLKLYQAWFNKNFLGSTLSVLAGVYPIDAEFYVTDSSGIFLHPSFGVGAELGQTGKNGPSIYPISSLGVRLKYEPLPTLYVQAALLDGDPGSGRAAHWTRLNPFHGDGSLFMAEIGYHPGEAYHMSEHIEADKSAIPDTVKKLEDQYEPIGKYAIGLWSYSKGFNDLLDTSPGGNSLQRKNRGIYLLMENSVYRAKDMERDAAIFFRYGLADKNINTFDYSASIGLRVRGLIGGRVDYFFGIAATRSNAGEKFRLAQQAAGIAIPGNETVVETTYRAKINSWLIVQPSIQRIFNPSLAPDVRPATVIGVRCEMSL